MESGSGIEQIQPNSYNKQINLLPGSDERKAKLVDSLDELKSQMDKDNRKADQKTRTINKYIIVTSIGVATTLLLTGNNTDKKDKKGNSIKRVLRTAGTILSIGGMIKGISSMGNSYVDVIEKNSNIKTDLDKNYSYSNKVSNEDRSKLVELAVTSVMDLILKLKLMSTSDMKNKTRSLKYKSAKGITKKVIEEILSYEYRK
jgi:hypothetical protein